MVDGEKEKWLPGGCCSHHRSKGDVDTFSPELGAHGSTAGADEGPVEAAVLSEMVRLSSCSTYVAAALISLCADMSG